MLSHLKNYDIILGSSSPRRKDLLAGLEIPFRVETNDVDESYPEQLSGEKIPVYLAKIKAASYTLRDNSLLITADTIVWGNGEVFGKPTDFEDGKRILNALAGKTHQVITGVCIRSQNREKCFHVTTNVTFRALSEQEIEHYLHNYKPYDKAGAYAIQEWIGFVGVEGIEGSYFNVMGMPVQRLYCELKNWK